MSREADRGGDFLERKLEKLERLVDVAGHPGEMGGRLAGNKDPAKSRGGRYAPTVGGEVTRRRDHDVRCGRPKRAQGLKTDLTPLVIHV